MAAILSFFREMLGIKQEGLAKDLEDDWRQKKISTIEHQEVIDDSFLEHVTKLLKLPVEAIKSFDEEASVNIISNTFSNFKDNVIANTNYYTFIPLAKFIKALEENKKYMNVYCRFREKRINCCKSCWIKILYVAE